MENLFVPSCVLHFRSVLQLLLRAQKHLLFNLSTLFYLNVLDAHGWFEKEMVASTCCKRDSPVSKSNEEQISREVNRKLQGDQGIGEGS